MHFINISDLVGRDWRFLEPLSTDPEISWSMHYGRPSNLLERSVRKIAFGRYRASWSAVREAQSRKDAVIVSHLPRVSAACNLLRTKLCPDKPHIGFAFNFTDLPTGKDRIRLTNWLANIDDFVVFSKYEVDLYPGYFDIPPERITHLPWAMAPPEIGPHNPVETSERYLCSIGGEGRDYALLAKAMRKLPSLKMVVIARPRSIVGVDFPDNVTVFTDMPSPETWRIAVESDGLIIPLRDEQTPCGHITIIGAQLLGVPLAVTHSLGIADYIVHERNGLTIPAGNITAMIECLQRFHDDPLAACQMANKAKEIAAQRNNLQVWVKYFEDFANTRS